MGFDPFYYSQSSTPYMQQVVLATYRGPCVEFVDDERALAEWRRQCAMIQAMAPVADERGVVRLGRPMNLHRFGTNPVRFARSQPPPKYSFYQGDF